MRVEQLGEGEPRVAVVGGIHGDEPCGVRAVERLVEDPPDVSAPVKLVVANERAVEAGQRYVDADLNRAFPGDPDAREHERRLAAALARELAGCSVLALHSTQSHPEAFAIVATLDDWGRRTCPQLPVAALVETGTFVDGRLFAVPDTNVMEVECGLQGSEAAAENAHDLSRAFLAATGVLDAPEFTAAPTRELPVFRLTRQIPKAPASEYEVRAENFRQVAGGETFATADGRRVHAEEAFYPVLLSPYGYEDVFGYAAERVDSLAAGAEHHEVGE